ncbi:MAG: aminomethyl transferase family protein [bacterium]|nr:aminomethyl transferase family protein [bacterium]
MTDHPLDAILLKRRASFADVSGVPVAVDFGDPVAEYAAAVSGAGLYDARERGLIEVTGRDRADWLHNLVTNTVKDLPPGSGRYAFALNVKGRILFDCNLLVLEESVWLDLDGRTVAAAMTHFNKYTIMEDVGVTDRSDEFVRVALMGPKVADLADALGATEAPQMASLDSAQVSLTNQTCRMVRHDAAGVLGLELFLERGDAVAGWQHLLEIGASVNLTPIGRSAVQTLRIEAGIPAYGQDIDDTVLPAETRQIERGVSFTKGCYLGQEVVERMRSRGSLARQLVGLRFAGERVPPVPVALSVGDQESGRLTSACWSPALEAVIGLGYLKSAHTNPGTVVATAGPEPVTGKVVALPIRVSG